jgi:hypothetical protein
MVSVHYNERVWSLRLAYLAALALWVGGLAALGAAAPVIFEVLQERLPGTGRALAGVLFGEVLGRFRPWLFASAAVMALALVGMALIGPRPRPYARRLAIIGAMVLLTYLATGPVRERIDRARDQAGVTMASLPESDPRRISFGRLHALSNVLVLGSVLGGLVLLFWEARS